jgi:hypothetical protein
METKIIKVFDTIKDINQQDNGMDYRKNVFEPAVIDAITNKYKLVIDLNRVKGYRSSFLRNAFASIINDGIVNYDDFIKYVQFYSPDRPSYEREILLYINEAK